MSAKRSGRAGAASEGDGVTAPQSEADLVASNDAAREFAATQRGFERIARLEVLKLVFRQDWLVTDPGRIIRETERLTHFVVHGVDPGQQATTG